jgi:hypothetical protein
MTYHYRVGLSGIVVLLTLVTAIEIDGQDVRSGVRAAKTSAGDAKSQAEAASPNSAVEAQSKPTAADEHLSQLDWMVGEWADEDPKAAVRLTCRWTRNGSFLTRSFAADFGNGNMLDGTEVIGWDPVNQSIRGWVFDSDGGFANEIWNRKGNTWTVTTRSTLPDGRTGTLTRVITKIGDDQFTTTTVSREVDGELLPNIGPITAVRKKETKATTNAR